MDTFESACKFLHNTFVATTGYQVSGYYAKRDTTLLALKRQLAKQTEAFWEIPVSFAGLEILQDHLRSYKGSARPVAWLQQPDFSETSWRDILPRLNFHRDAIGKLQPLLLVIAGPYGLYTLFEERAHDLHSIAQHTSIDDSVESRPEREPLRWLHLSDFHFKAKEDWRQRLPLQALLLKLTELKNEGLAPHLIFITGDIAFSGQVDEYRKALDFFDSLSRTLELPRRCFFLVPGNHDVDRQLIKPMQNILLSSVADAASLRVLMDDAEMMQAITRRQQAFLDFTAEFLGGARAWPPLQPWRADMVELEGWRIGIMQLNKVWAGGLAGDKGKLYFSEQQILDQLEIVQGSEVVFALCHHPLSYLADFDEQRSRELLGKGAHFLLRGHLHRNDARGPLALGGCLELSAGAVLEQDPHYTGFMLGSLDPEGGGQVHFFCYSDRGKGFWAADTRFDQSAPQGIWEIPFKLETATPIPAQAKRTQRLAQRYRDAVLGYYGSIHFIGLPRTGLRTECQVEKLFVPLRLSADRNKDQKDLNTEALEQQLSEGKPLRTVVLGDPGSGKSTLCRYLAARLAAQTHGKLPMVLPFREYVNSASERGLLAFLAHQAEQEYSLCIGMDQLESWLEQGEVVLLLDGMDEVGDPRLRVAMRDRILAFCQAWPKVAVVLTSRIVGYDEAPLPGPFKHWRLAPFSDEEQQLFVIRWYEAQELPPDQNANDRALLLLDGLRGSPAARELARNPLLATLLALVHYTQMTLPGQRAELYHLCVETLLVTWPERRKSSFPELEVQQQRDYLEKIAWWLQMGRARGNEYLLEGNEGANNILVSHGELVTFLEELFIIDRHPQAQTLAKSWLSYLERTSGILLEQRSGYLGFFHLSLLEYLAGQRLLNQEPELDAFIFARCNDGHWREVCLLALGSQAQKVSLSNALFKRVLEKGNEKVKTWRFMLLAAREGVYFSEEQLHEILDRNALVALKGWTYTAIELGGYFNDLIRFSKKHSPAALSWQNQRLRLSGTRLAEAIALFHMNETVIAQLNDSAHEQRVQLAGAEASPFLPQVAKWMYGMTADTALLWQKQLGIDVEIWAHIRFVSAPEGPILAALATRGAHSMIGALEASQQGFERYRSKSKILFFAMQIEDVPFHFLVPVRSAPVDLQLRLCSNNITLDTAQNFAKDYARDFALNFGQDSALELAPDFARDFAQYFTRNFGQNPSLDISNDFALDFALNSAPDFARNPQDLKTLTASLKNCPILLRDKEYRLTVPPFQGRIKDLKKWLLIQGLQGYLGAVIEAQFGMVENPMIHLRHQAETLLLYWPAMEEKWNTDGPYALAHYLSLGVHQTLLTWRWPSTERWQRTVAQRPEHWLPRAFYHQAHLLESLGRSSEHRQGYLNALEEGRADSALPGYADALPGPLEPYEGYHVSHEPNKTPNTQF